MSEQVFFGLCAPEGTETFWGCRAIFRDGTIDIVWDRTSSDGDLKASGLEKWLNEQALPYLRHLAAHDDDFPQPNEYRSVEVFGDGFYLRANPQRSYGYLYIGAWPSASLAHQEATPKVPVKRAIKRRTTPGLKRRTIY
jgi:hypothetical protein